MALARAAHGSETIFSFTGHIEEAQFFTESMQNLSSAEAVDITDVRWRALAGGAPALSRDGAVPRAVVGV